MPRRRRDFRQSGLVGRSLQECRLGTATAAQVRDGDKPAKCRTVRANGIHRAAPRNSGTCATLVNGRVASWLEYSRSLTFTTARGAYIPWSSGVAAGMRARLPSRRGERSPRRGLHLLARSIRTVCGHGCFFSDWILERARGGRAGSSVPLRRFRRESKLIRQGRTPTGGGPSGSRSEFSAASIQGCGCCRKSCRAGWA